MGCFIEFPLGEVDLKRWKSVADMNNSMRVSADFFASFKFFTLFTIASF